MTYGQIITLLFILLILYYAGLVTMDIIAAKRMKASEEAKNEEAEIDISGLAGGFEPVEINRDNSRPTTVPQNMGAVRYKEPVMTNGYPVDSLISKTKMPLNPVDMTTSTILYISVRRHNSCPGHRPDLSLCK